MTSLKERSAYFAIKNEAYASPKGVYNKQVSDPDNILVVDVRNPLAPITSRISGSIWIPEEEIEARMSELPQDKLIVLYCWDVWCGLASEAAVHLLNAGYNVKELHGGVKAWMLLRQPMDKLTNPVEA
jgi:rhodanese-related sulfurtransferase